MQGGGGGHVQFSRSGVGEGLVQFSSSGNGGEQVQFSNSGGWRGAHAVLKFMGGSSTVFKWKEGWLDKKRLFYNTDVHYLIGLHM